MDATWDLLQEEFDEEMKEDLEQEVINFKAKWMNTNCNYY